MLFRTYSLIFQATHSVQVPSQGHSEPSHTEEDTSGEEDDDLMSLSPASSASCHQPPPLIITENCAHSCLAMSPTEWSTKEVSKFIASLQGWKHFVLIGIENV